MATTKRRTMPKHFFPNATPKTQIFLWHKLVNQHRSLHEAMDQYLPNSTSTSMQQEVADMIIDGFEEDWRTHKAVEHLKRTIGFWSYD